GEARRSQSRRRHRRHHHQSRRPYRSTSHEENGTHSSCQPRAKGPLDPGANRRLLGHKRMTRCRKQLICFGPLLQRQAVVSPLRPPAPRLPIFKRPHHPRIRAQRVLRSW
ncbi:unnamed protein product, partial [Symbiodinium necroappetens]